MNNSDSVAMMGPDETFRPYAPDVRTILEAVYRSRGGCFYVTHASSNVIGTSSNVIHARNRFLHAPQIDTDPEEQAPQSLKALTAKAWRWLLNS